LLIGGSIEQAMYLERKKINKPKKESVILFCCHVLNDNIMREFRKINDYCSKNFDIVLSYDNSRHDLKIEGRYKYNIVYNGIGEKLGYNSKLFVNIPELHLKYPELYFSPEYHLLAFYLENQNYKYYWRIDYDVRFYGKWNKFFDSFLKNDADLIAANLKSYIEDEYKKLWMWNKINLVEVDNSKKLRVFFPIVRLSNRALRLLDRRYKTGIYGFCEIIVPTLLNLEGFKIQDMGKQWYDDSIFSMDETTLKKKNKLHHTVECLRVVPMPWHSLKKP